MDPVLQETIDYVAIRRLQSAYADIITRRAWPELHTIFRPDTQVTIDMGSGDPLVLDGPDGVGGFISGAIEHFDLFEFIIVNTVIDVAGDDATARMYMWELRHDPANGRSDAYGLYQDRYARVDGRWWFAGRAYRSLARTAAPGGTDLEVLPFPDL